MSGYVLSLHREGRSAVVRQERAWFVYLVRASDGSYYTGTSTDVDRRVREHNEGWRGAKYLRGRRPVELVWRSAGLPKRSALRVEREVKKMSHAEKAALARAGWRESARGDPMGEVNALLSALDRERAPQTLEEVGDHPDPPEDRYDRWEP